MLRVSEKPSLYGGDARHCINGFCPILALCGSCPCEAVVPISPVDGTAMFAERVDRLMHLRLWRAKTTIELEGLLGVTWRYDVSSPAVRCVENLDDLL